jgi:hypothetical protein
MKLLQKGRERNRERRKGRKRGRKEESFKHTKRGRESVDKREGNGVKKHRERKTDGEDSREEERRKGIKKVMKSR